MLNRLPTSLRVWAFLYTGSIILNIIYGFSPFWLLAWLLAFPLITIFFYVQEDEGNIKNYDQLSVTNKLKYSTMEFLLKSIWNINLSSIHYDNKYKTITIKIWDTSIFVITPSGTVMLNDSEIMTKDSYWKYLYNYISNNWNNLLNTRNILRQMPKDGITKEEIISNLENDIKKTFEDVQLINQYTDAIQKIRQKYHKKYEWLEQHTRVKV